MHMAQPHLFDGNAFLVLSYTQIAGLPSPVERMKKNWENHQVFHGTSKQSALVSVTETSINYKLRRKGRGRRREKL